MCQRKSLISHLARQSEPPSIRKRMISRELHLKIEMPLQVIDFSPVIASLHVSSPHFSARRVWFLAGCVKNGVYLNRGAWKKRDVNNKGRVLAHSQCSGVESERRQRDANCANHHEFSEPKFLFQIL